MNTLTAFTALVNDKELCIAKGIKAKDMYDYRSRVRNKKISIEKMEAVLAQAGYQMKQQTEWYTPEQWAKIRQTF